jgi:predicted acylesterase/phospholipase RssA
MFAVDLNSMPLQATDISYKTFPDLQLVKALTMTAAIPFIFKPVIIDNKCFVDGGLVLNFPLDACLKDTECERDEVLAFKNLKLLDASNKLSIVTESTSLGGFWYYMTKVLVNQVNGKTHQPVVPNIVNCIIDDVCGYSDWAKILETRECREKCIKNGETSAHIFKTYKTLH